MLSAYEEKLMNDYFDPGKAWDRYCDAEEAAYKAWYEEAQCRNCTYCMYPNPGMFTDPNVGFCPQWVEDFICLSDTPSDYECEDAAPRG